MKKCQRDNFLSFKLTFFQNKSLICIQQRSLMRIYAGPHPDLQPPYFRADVGAIYIKEFLFIQVSVGGQKHYLRLTTLPHGVRLGDERETVPVVAGGRPAAGKPPSPSREPGTNCTFYATSPVPKEVLCLFD